MTGSVVDFIEVEESFQIFEVKAENQVKFDNFDGFTVVEKQEIPPSSATENSSVGNQSHIPVKVGFFGLFFQFKKLRKMTEKEKCSLYSVNELKKMLGEHVDAIVIEGQEEPQNGFLGRNLCEAEEILNVLGGGDNPSSASPCLDAENNTCSPNLGQSLELSH